MAFIRVQKLKRADDGSIISGSASILVSVYDPDRKFHSTHKVKERLGKVIWLSESKRSGIFLSDTRGLVLYDADSDSFSEVEKDDPRIIHAHLFPEPQVHTVFGDSYLLLEFLKNSGFLKLLTSLFSKNEDQQRLLCHILHTVLKQGSRIDCESFLERSFASLLFRDVVNSSLASDTRFFDLMGEDKTKVDFFRSYVHYMKKLDPAFGKGCFVDSTPLPNDIRENVLNAFSSHGLGGGALQVRLAMVLDKATGMPVWYQLLPGNVIDMKTLDSIREDVKKSVGIKIEQFVLDAGYVEKQLIEKIHIGTKETMIARCPNRRGYHYNTLYDQIMTSIRQSKYDFVRREHTYFGRRKEQEYFGFSEYAYIYVDRENALKGYREYQISKPEEFAKLKDKEKNWKSVESGFFILISNLKEEPSELLNKYFSRMEIEKFFKTSKEYLDLLPLSKWSVKRFEGKILTDIIATIIWKKLQAVVNESGLSVDRMWSKTSSLMGINNGKGDYVVESPNKNTKDFYSLLGFIVPSRVEIADYILSLGLKNDQQK